MSARWNEPPYAYPARGKAGGASVPIKEGIGGDRLEAMAFASFGRGPLTMNDSLPDASAAKVRRSRSVAKPADRKAGRADGRTKATLLLPESLDFRLTAVAKSQRMDRSQLAAQLLDAGLRRYALDAALRQHAGDAAGEEGGAGE